VAPPKEIIDSSELDALRLAVNGESGVHEALVRHVGGRILRDMWRFYSAQHPNGGVEGWNRDWRAAWSLPSDKVCAVGEDLFGNQLVQLTPRETVYIFNHEDGFCHDLELGMVDLLDAVFNHGFEWIDFYANGCLEAATPLMKNLSWEQHLHWRQPLSLGGRPVFENLVVAERGAHLSWHAQFWRQISDLPPGSEIRLRPE
jgi:hypothetical protein